MKLIYFYFRGLRFSIHSVNTVIITFIHLFLPLHELKEIKFMKERNEMYWLNDLISFQWVKVGYNFRYVFIKSFNCSLFMNSFILHHFRKRRMSGKGWNDWENDGMATTNNKFISLNLILIMNATSHSEWSELLK